MEVTRQWKIAGAAATAAIALGIGAVAGAVADDGGSSGASGIRLRDSAAISDTKAPTPVGGGADDRQASPDGESFDSPLQSPDDSPPGRDSVDTPGDSFDSPDVRAPAAPAPPPPRPAPAAAPAPPPPPPPAPAPAPPPPADSWDSPDSVSFDSPS